MERWKSGHFSAQDSIGVCRGILPVIPLRSVRTAIANTGQVTPAGPQWIHEIKYLRINQYARVQNCVRIERSFRGYKRARKTLRTLTIVPAPMIAADRMMMGDSAAEPDQFVRYCCFDLVPLLQF